MSRAITCHHCQQPAKLVDGKVVYPHRPDLAHKSFWACMPCRAWVGCHPPAGVNGLGGQGDGTKPLGRLANADERAAKQRAHAALDPLWRNGGMRRREAYRWLAVQLGIPFNRCHIGYFNPDECARVVALVQARNA